MGSLPIDRKSTAMSHSPVTIDIHQSLDVELNLFPKIPLDSSLILNDFTDTSSFFFGLVLDLRIYIHFRFIQNAR